MREARCMKDCQPQLSQEAVNELEVVSVAAKVKAHLQNNNQVSPGSFDMDGVKHSPQQLL